MGMMNYKPSARDSLRSAAYRAVSYRPLTAKELRAKLQKRKDADNEMIESIIQELVKDRYIDETLIAEDVVRRGKEVNLLARRLLQRDLLHRGISQDIINDVLDEQYPETDEYLVARTLALKKLSTLKGVSANKRFNRIGGALGRKGFPSYIIAEVLRNIDLKDEDPDNE
jgi:regulatory protein